MLVWGEHIGRLLHGLHDSRLQADFEIYGIDSISFEIIEFMPYADEGQIKGREQYWIDSLKAQGVDLYNTSNEIHVYNTPASKSLGKDWYTTEELMELFGVNRQRLCVIARTRKWRFEEVESNRSLKGKRYLATDIEFEIERRAKLGLKAYGNRRVKGVDKVNGNVL